MAGARRVQNVLIVAFLVVFVAGGLAVCFVALRSVFRGVGQAGATLDGAVAREYQGLIDARVLTRQPLPMQALLTGELHGLALQLTVTVGNNKGQPVERTWLFVKYPQALRFEGTIRQRGPATAGAPFEEAFEVTGADAAKVRACLAGTAGELVAFGAEFGPEVTVDRHFVQWQQRTVELGGRGEAMVRRLARLAVDVRQRLDGCE